MCDEKAVFCNDGVGADTEQYSVWSPDSLPTLGVCLRAPYARFTHFHFASYRTG